MRGQHLWWSIRCHQWVRTCHLAPPHSRSPLERYVQLPPTKLLKKSSVRRLSQEDGEIRDTSTTITNLNLKPVPPCASSIISGNEPPTPAVLAPSSLPPPRTPNGVVASVERTWHSTWTRQEVGMASCSFLTSDFALRLHVRVKPPTAPRSMNLAKGPSTLPLSSLNPKPPRRRARERWSRGRVRGILSGSSSTTTSTAAANMSTLPSAPPTSSLSTSSTLASPSLPTTTTQCIPRGPSDERFGAVADPIELSVAVRNPINSCFCLSCLAQQISRLHRGCQSWGD